MAIGNVRRISSSEAYQRLSRSPVGDLLRPGARWARTLRPTHSFNDEDTIIAGLTNRPGTKRFCVDIAAADGVSMSNTLALYRRGWAGLSVEMDGDRFRSLARIHARFPESVLFRGRVTPDNVIDILRAAGVPQDFGFLNLDIDGYDHFVLERILEQYRPLVICAEINEKVPPPLRFTVNYDPTYVPTTDGFYGQSVCHLGDQIERFGYVIVAAEYCNVFLLPTEETAGERTFSPEEAWRVGYRERPDRLERFPWNAELEPTLTMSPSDAAAWLRRRYAEHEGQYTLVVPSR